MPNEPRPNKNQRREEARAKAAALRAQQERAHKRNRMLAIGGLAVAVIALIVVVVVVVGNLGKASSAASGGSVALPAASGVPSTGAVTPPTGADTATGGLPVSSLGVGKAAASGVKVDVYFDFMCPWCGEFDRTNAADLNALVAEGDVTVVYHPISILDSKSTSNYSTRAANAAWVVADKDPTHFAAFVTAMYASGTQPEEGSAGLSDDKIAQVAQGVGVPSSVTATFTDTVTFQGATVRTFAPWIAAATALTPKSSSGYVQTPTLVINGTQWTGDFTTAGTFKAAVEAAKG